MKKNEVTKPNNAIDIGAFGGFDVSKMTASSIILVQGNNPLKKTLKCFDGTFVSDNQILGESFDAIPIKSEELFDVFDKDPSDPLAKHLRTVKLKETIDSVAPVNENEAYPNLFIDVDANYYQTKIVIIVALNGLPCRLVFKSRSKLISAQKIQETFFKTCKFRGLTDPAQAVFKFYSEEKTGKLGSYYTINCVFERPASEEEMQAIAPFKQLDITLVKESELE